MNLVGETGNAGAVAFGGPQQTAPANPCYTVGEIGFGPTWSDDEPSLRQMYDAACQTIVRLECEVEERDARIAVLEEQARILATERDEARDAVCRLRRERAAQDGVVEALRDQLCADKCRDKAAADGGWANI